MTDTSSGNKKYALVFVATNGGLGFAPFAPGTFGTLAGIPAFYYLSQLPGLVQLVVLTAVIAVSIPICRQAGTFFGEADDSRIVFDELAGYLTATVLLPFSWGTALLAFFWFRLFDILKPPPINLVDRHYKNGFGVTFDDIIAGLYAAIAIRICLALFT